MKNHLNFIALLFILLLHASAAAAQIKKIWLTHSTSSPSHIVINWETSEPGNSEVFYGLSTSYENHITRKENVTLHHVEIPLDKKDTVYHYMVKTGGQTSAKHSFRSYPTDELKVVVVGNWGFAVAPDFSHMLKDKPNLLITCGDNVPSLYEACGEGVKDCVKPFTEFVAAYPEIFSSIPFMPALGNHDKQITPRGTRFPKDPVYDVDATAYRRFVELPGDEWKWQFNIPEFDVSFVALDLNHMSDLGTTYQSSHDYRVSAEQFQWYRNVMNSQRTGFTVTVSNESNTVMRKVENGAWNQEMRKGTAVIAGFGHYMERAEVDGFPYFNTSLKFGDVYPDTFAKITKGMPGYLLLTFRKGKPMVAELKSLDGKVVERTEWAAGK